MRKNKRNDWPEVLKLTAFATDWSSRKAYLKEGA